MAITIPVTITGPNGTPLTVEDAVNGNADVPNPGQLERAVIDAAKWTRINDVPTRVQWDAKHGWWVWDPEAA